ncbi:hypothetical protein L208DRAFT_752498 [Tricholoma matsutake]|nr:hypothetical protein L208DRAFT_752498 [Tricholoma matsutake 945]
MHSSRQLTSPTHAQSPTRHAESSSSDPPPATYSSQTSLPSIRQLHPYLQLSSLSQHHPTSSSYNYPQFAHHVAQADPQIGARRNSEAFGSLDSEGDDAEQRHGPPKKKRRRQPLSCTECKRRKIKCDRAQPCAPCTRRGEQSKCQWHIIEPVEKYVTRAEYDELRARFDELSAQVQRLLPMAGVPPYYQMGIPSGIPGPSTEAVSTYAGSSSVMYQSMMPPPHTYPHHLDASTQGAQDRFIKPEDIQTPSRHHHTSIATTSAVPLTHVSSSMRSRPPEKPLASAATGTTSGAKNSPLSLASITSPFHSDPQLYQSKNCHAQMLALGECLRTGSHKTPEGPATHYETIRLRLLLRLRSHSPPSQGPRRKYMAIVPCNYQPAASWSYAYSLSHPHHLKDSLIHLFLRFSCHGTRIESH